MIRELAHWQGTGFRSTWIKRDQDGSGLRVLALRFFREFVAFRECHVAVC